MNQGVTLEETTELMGIIPELEAYKITLAYDLNKLVEAVEIEKIHFALEVNKGNRTRAAEMLGLKRTCLLAKMRKYEIVY
jgi:DNA-binding NtrC family response regulator